MPAPPMVFPSDRTPLAAVHTGRRAHSARDAFTDDQRPYHLLTFSRLAPAFLALGLASQIGRAQTSVTHDTVTEARTQRDAGRLEPAARLLRPYVAAHPEQPQAALLLGETLYWLKDRAGARRVFESAIARHPSTIELRLAYGRMLVEIGDEARARELLEPLVGTRASRGRAETSLGMAAYWGGDHSTARRLFGAALAADSGIDEARTALRDILRTAAPRVQIGARSLRDDQPLDRTSMELRVGVHATPLMGISARVEPIRFQLDGGSTSRLTVIEGGVAGYIPAARTELDLAGGTVARDTSSAWIGRLGIGLRARGGLTLRARAERSQYLNTMASISTPIMVETFGTSLDWSHRSGWLAQASASRDLFPDDNSVSTGYVWILAPIARTAATEMHVGYAFTAQGAEESRYAIVSGGGSGPGFPSTTAGAYIPYYTPLDLRSHTALASIILRLGTHLTLRGGGGYGAAQEIGESVERRSAGPFQPPTDVIVRAPRTFFPWNARMSVDAALGEWLTLTASGESMRTAYYRASTLRVGLTQAFTTPSLRRLDRR